MTISLSHLTLCSQRLGPLPLVNHVLRRLGLEAILAAAIPRSRRQSLPHAKALGVLLRSVLVEREPIYRQQETVATFAPDAFGLDADEVEQVGDDAIGRALDRLFDTDRGSLLTQVVVAAVKQFQLSLEELHDDSTSIKFTGQYRSARGRRVRGKRTARGREFGEDGLDIRLGDVALPVIDSGDTWAIAELDCATPPGDYLLELSRGLPRTDADVLSLTLGAVGPQGPIGPVGPPGPQGEHGLSGLEIVRYSTLGRILSTDLIYEYDCPAGKRLLGAGWDVDPELSEHGSTGIVMHEWYPVDGNTWAFRPAPSLSGVVLEISLVCVNAD